MERSFRIVRRLAAYVVVAFLWGCGGSGNSGPTVARVEVSPTAILMTGSGQARALTARAFDSSGAEMTGITFTYSSSRPLEASVGSDGAVQAEVALGSALISVSAGGISATPVLVTVAEPFSGAILVSDEQVVTPPQLLAGSISGIGGQFTVTVSGIAAPAPGTIALASGSYPIAGKVSSSNVVQGGVELTITLVPLNELFPDLSISASFTAAELAPFRTTASAAATAMDRASILSIDPKASVSGGSWQCDTSFDPALLTFELTSELIPSPTTPEDSAFDIDINFTSLRFERALIFYRETGAINLRGSIGVASATGTVECAKNLTTVTIPVNGFLSMLIAPRIPFGIKFSVDVSGGSDISLSVETGLQYRIEPRITWDPTSGWTNLSDLEIDPTSMRITPSFPEGTPRVGLTTFGGLTAGITIGSKIVNEDLPPAIEVSAGIEAASDWALPIDVATDPTVESADKLTARGQVGAGQALDDLMKKIVGNFAPLVDVDLTFKLEEVLAESPKMVAAYASHSTFAASDSLVFQVNLDPLLVKELGVYNVEEVRIYQIDRQSTPQTARLIATGVPASGQSNFTIPWTATTAGSVSSVGGAPTFFAFVVPKLSFLRTTFPVGLGKVDGPSIVLTPTNTTVLTGNSVTFAVRLDGEIASSGFTLQATGGTISAAGQYTAGSTPGSYQVKATRTSTGEVAIAMVQIQQAVLPPTVTSVTVTPTVLTVGTSTTFAFSGTNLQPGYLLSFPGCNAVESASSSTTTRQFSCTLSQAGTGLQGSISTGSGTLLFSFSRTVNAAATGRSVSVTVTGLTGTGLVLRNNGGNNLGIPTNGTFTFSTTLLSGAAYNVTVLTQPSNPTQTCTVSNGAGTVGSSNVTNIGVACTTSTTYTIGGVVSGLSGSGLVLRNNASDNIAINTNGAFVFGTNLASGATYNVTVPTQPSSPAQTCTVSNGSGTVTNANVANISVGCVAAQSPPSPQTIAAGQGHSLILRADGALMTAGLNAFGQLGDIGQSGDIFESALTGVKAVAAGEFHSFALKTNGTLWAAGRNVDGQLGTGNAAAINSPFVQVLSNVASAAGCDRHSLALKSDGTLWATGNNEVGQLGAGNQTSRLSFIQVLTNVTSMACGVSHTMAVKADGTLWAAGFSLGGGLGTGNNATQLTFVQVATNVSAVSAGQDFTLALKSDGTVWAAGYGAGTGLVTNSQPFTQVLSGVKALSSSWSHSLALKTDGSLWATGSNTFGQLGTGDNNNRATFVQVSSGVVAISAGTGHSLALRSNGTVWGTGPQFSLGLGFGGNLNTFTQVFSGALVPP